MGQDSEGSAVYGLGLVGAAGLWPVILGILKALVWPALVVYKLLEFLGI